MKEFDIPAVEAALSRLREIDAQGFVMNPVLSSPETAAFERDHKVVLPSDYRQFITELGNGGAGPFYGVFPLGYMDDNLGQRRWQEDDGFIGALSKPFPFSSEWNDLSGKPDTNLITQDPEKYDKQVEQFCERYWSSKLVSGAFPTCHEGCALRIWLVVTGEQAGKLWEDGRSEYAGLRPLRLSDGSSATFSEWYNEWLDTCFTTAGQPNWR